MFEGNLHQLFNKDGWGFHKHIVDTYGSVVKVHGLFGVNEILNEVLTWLKLTSGNHIGQTVVCF